MTHERIRLGISACLLGEPVRFDGVPYLADQVYLRPHPVELMLRNHV